jgi:hypothetical protein
VTESDLRELLTKTVWLKEIVNNARVFRLTPNQFYKLKKSGKLPAQELTKTLIDKYSAEFSKVVPNYKSLLNWKVIDRSQVFQEFIDGTQEERDVIRAIFKAFPFFAVAYGINLATRNQKDDREKTIEAASKFLSIETATSIPVEVETYLNMVPITLPDFRSDALLLQFFLAGVKADKKWKPDMPPKELLTYYKKTLDLL